MSVDLKRTFTLDGSPLTATEGETILQAMLAAGLDFPHICYHPALGPIETCDTCMVEVNGDLVRACATPVVEGMSVRTKSVAARYARKEAMDRILKNHDLYCTVCDNNNGNCVVHNTTMAMDIDHQSYPFREKPYEVDMSHPFYRYDPSQCILCGRCVEACQNLQVSEVLSIDWDREIPRVIWDNDVPINESSCVSCGHCVTVCPCNALMEKSMLGKAGFLTGIEPEPLQRMIDVTKAVEPGYRAIFAISEIESHMRNSRIKRTKTVCTYCGVGCSFDIWTKDRDILKVEPQMEAPTNQISTCVKGKFGWDFVNSPDRLTKPLIRKGDAFHEVSWDEALDFVAKRLTEIRQQYGDDAIALISSSKCTNEENYLMQKLARAVLHTNNIDNCSRYCQSPATEGLRRTMGYGGDTGSLHDLAMADLLIIIGANPAESHPVFSTRMRRAKKKYGQKHIVIDLREHDMAHRADLFVRPNPGTDLVLISAVTRYIIDQGWHDADFVRDRVDGFEDFVRSLEPYTLEYAERVTGVPRDTVIQIATMIHEAKSTCICWAMGVTQHKGGSETSTAICNLLLVTGNVGRPGTGAYPLRGHNNVQGAGDMGCSPVYMPGYERVDDPAVRAKYETAWVVELPTSKGLDNHEMVDAIHEGKLRALIIQGEEMALVDSNSHYVREAFAKLDLLVVIDVFFSKTAEYADVVLAASPSLEKEGTFTNTERRIQRLYQVFEPLGESRPDWVILRDLANRLGANWTYAHPSEILEEMASLAALMQGVRWDRLEGYRSLQWPVHPDGTDTPLLYTNGFPFPNGKARLVPARWIEPTAFEPEYDLHLNNGRMLEHFHEGNLTYRVHGLKEKVPTTYLEVSPELAKERGIETGALVRLISPYGELKLPVVVTDRVKGKQMYLPMNTSNDEEAINILTSSESDETTHTPAYKELQVRMEVIRPRGESPMTRFNFRMHRPNPQSGVRVERKWSRRGYVPVAEAAKEKARG
ncbi:formate dehydrogenase subunit alpha [Alicyclobacillus acidocaldarius]|uniref:Formate dehydrogenase, alpha subunit n=1 Tax=Alicyclobacillus acidocaldarius subsp. acidocaldarius (strain ATCC 27009 / DSM 446 / BCRC 14685 / JCM 5260 / KCTC 1825 / NBRC 15652 / NCIMB 11725 / NRRL B-14509 / 104-IA) TaxID=521098 RepID=C8WXX5_ALIAD|nr:formate dehydrogenase subunit alpha [Alicyclobacillus acidocaldarius]ACV58937.1 formate dehydrogenase, alpha subunit [Alicyclobacillus acidocaldarius subsp. acidocaldarius DSM 446]